VIDHRCKGNYNVTKYKPNDPRLEQNEMKKKTDKNTCMCSQTLFFQNKSQKHKNWRNQVHSVIQNSNTIYTHSRNNAFFSSNLNWFNCNTFENLTLEFEYFLTLAQNSKNCSFHITSQTLFYNSNNWQTDWKKNYLQLWLYSCHQDKPFLFCCCWPTSLGELRS